MHTNLISTFLLVLNANEKCFNGDCFVYKSKENTVTQSGVDESTVKATPKASDTGKMWLILMA